MNAAAFLDAILNEPDDMDHRLVYADWLDDHGDSARAEFIRLQIERDSLHPADPRVRACLAREQQLLAANESEWTGSVRPLVWRWRFHRGFVEEVRLDAEAFLSVGEELFRRAPIRRVQLRRLGSLADLLDQAPYRKRQFADLLCRLRVLEFGCIFGTDPCGRMLTDLPRIPRLEELRLRHGRVGGQEAHLLAASPLLSSLRRLEISPSSRESESFEELLHSPLLNRLEHLELISFGTRTLSQLLGSPLLSHLRSLALGHASLDAEALNDLVSSPAVARLEALDLPFNPIGAAGIRHLTRSPHLGQLRMLNLSRTEAGDEGAQALAESSLLGRLRGIDLSLNQIGDEGGLAIAGYERENRLGTLDLIYNQMGAETQQALCERFGEEVCLFRR